MLSFGVNHLSMASSRWELHKSCAFPPRFLSSLVDIYEIIVLHLSCWTTHRGRGLTGGSCHCVWQAGEMLPCPGDPQSVGMKGDFRVQSLTNAVRPSYRLLVGTTEIPPLCLRCLGTAMLIILSIWCHIHLCWQSWEREEGARKEIKPRLFGFETFSWAPAPLGAVQGEQRLIPSDSIHRHEPDFLISMFPAFLSESCQPRSTSTSATEPSWAVYWISGSIRKALNRQTWLSPGVYSGVNPPIPCQETKAPAEKELDDLTLISFLI